MTRGWGGLYGLSLQLGVRSLLRHGLSRDAAIRIAIPLDPSRYLETFLIESWVEHLRQHQRGTISDRGIEDRARAFHIGETPPRAAHLIYAREKKETA